MLSQDQQNALDVFSDFIIDPAKKEMIISGHSGSGKSYLTKEMIQLAENSNQLRKLLIGRDIGNIDICLTATTNKAAEVLQRSSGRDANTIHNLLGLRVYSDHQTGKTKLTRAKGARIHSNSLIFIDEASMCDNLLLKFIRDSTMNCKVVYIGDPYQLTPIFDSNCPVFEAGMRQCVLTTPKRQIAGSPITALGEALRQTIVDGTFPNLIGDGNTVELLTGPEFKERVDEVYTNKENAKIVAWTNNRVNQYNSYVRKLFTQEKFFQPGEEVITNDPILQGGTTAFSTDSHAIIKSSYPGMQFGLDGHYVTLGNSRKQATVFMPNDKKEANRLIKRKARLKEWPEYFEIKQAIADLRPVHACTAHKSQGSTYETVFIDLEDIGKCNVPDDVARLLYVAITRASKQVYLYGALPDKYRSK